MMSSFGHQHRQMQNDYYWSNNFSFASENVLERSGAIAKDLQRIVGLLVGGKRSDARTLYRKGAYCQSVAAITLSDDTSLDGVLPIGTRVAGRNSNGRSIPGILVKPLSRGTTETTAHVQFIFNENDAGNPSRAVTQLCSVGGNPVPQLDRCK